MSYKLEKPYAEKERMDFIVEYNHNQGLRIEESENAIFALEPYELLINDSVQIDSEYETLMVQKEQERISHLSLTKREVFLALYNSKGILPEQIKALITDPADLIEFEYANEYFRGNPLIDFIGEQLGLSSKELDYLFENKTLLEVEND